MVFEDPDGTRILYDAGFTVRGPNDPRLGKIDAVLLSHVHGDHLGPAHQPAANAGTCGNPSFSVNVTPNSTTTMIAAGKKARILAGSDMHTFLAAKVKAAGGDPKQVQLVRFGALAKVGGVSVATVPATHTNGVPPEFLDKPLSDMLRAHGLNADVGPPVGYVLQFTNGLVAYLSGDTGITAEQDITVRRYYKANLAAQRRHRDPRQRDCDQGRQGRAGEQDRSIHEAGRHSGAPRSQRQDDVVRRQRQVHGRLPIVGTQPKEALPQWRGFFLE
jgi:L-ascorbate metabolism protein UlaG (beta-lactamase superfamily)